MPQSDAEPKQEQKSVARESHRGGFFAVNQRVWAQVAGIGINEATAYLVLACGKLRDNRTTSWSTQAVMKYGGIGWERAKAAIDNLLSAGYVRRAISSTHAHPRYELATHNELRELRFSERTIPQLVPAESAVLKKIELHRALNANEQKLARRLERKGLLYRDESTGMYEVMWNQVGSVVEGDLIWLPNEIVTGTPSEEEPPVARLRSLGCPWTLRLFIELYSLQNIRDDGGISRKVIHQKYERMKVGQRGAYSCWAIKWTLSHIDTTVPPFEAQVREHGLVGLVRRINTLEKMGLLLQVLHLIENKSESAEIIHPYGYGSPAEAPLESEIGELAGEAAQAMCLEKILNRARKAGFHIFCPAVSTRKHVQMVGIMRLTYRPRTSRTSVWFGELERKGRRWLKLFQELLEMAQEPMWKPQPEYNVKSESRKSRQGHQ